MVEPKSNMPEMDWQPALGGGIIAYPNGAEHKDQYLLIGPEDTKRPEGGWRFDWFIGWGGRFHGTYGSPTLEEAKRETTEAWWLAIERTEDWRPGDPQVEPYPRADPYAGVDWVQADANASKFKAEMKRRHEALLAERAEKRKIARATEKGTMGMIGPPDPRKGRIWKAKT